MYNIDSFHTHPIDILLLNQKYFTIDKVENCKWNKQKMWIIIIVGHPMNLNKRGPKTQANM